MHKAKGREFDNVFIMLDGFCPNKDEKLRLLYVAMTRAKMNLTIHYNGSYLDSINTENLETVNDNNVYLPPRQLALQLSHKDVHLDFFMSCQRQISELFSGDELAVNGEYCLNEKGQAVLRFSKQGQEKITSVKGNGYMLKSAKINFIVYWKKENTDNEIQIILPELYFERL
jgi:ATP-dependent DNA helicase RecQ